jgi:hypothetical protein
MPLSKNRSYHSPKSPVISYKPSVPAPPSHNPERPGFMSNVWQGFGLGAGQAIAHNIFRSNPVPEYDECKKHEGKQYEECLKYRECMKQTNNDKAVCDNLNVNKW